MIGFSVALLICGFIYNGLISVVYFNRKRVKNIENRVYRILLILNIFGVVLETLCFLTALFLPIDAILSIIVARLFLVYILLWVLGFTLYTFFICNDDRKIMKSYLENRKKWWTFISLISLCFLLPLLFLPMYFVNTGTFVYTYGPSTDFLVIIFVVGLILDLINIFSNLQIIRSKKILPLITFVIGLTILVVVRMINPGIQLITTTLTFVTILMYFTIENPDLDLIRKVNVSQDIAEKASNSTFNILNNISEYLKTSLKAIEDKEKKEVASDIIEIIDKLIEKSLIETGNLTLHTENYDVKEMFENIESLFKTLYNDKQLEIKFNIDKNIPNVLYGDSKRIKQILLILINSVIPSCKGKINVKIDSLNVGSLCRFKIYIKSSIKDKDKNEISLEDNMKKIDYDIATSLTNLMYGSIDINDPDYNYVLSISQRKVSGYNKVKEVKNDEIKKLSTSIFKDKRILFVYENIDKIKEFTSMVERYKINLDIAKSFKECINKLNEDVIYDIVFIDEMLSDVNGMDIIEALKKENRLSNYRLPPIIYITNVDYDRRKEYLEHGVYYCIDKPIDKYELDDKLNKILKNNN